MPLPLPVRHDKMLEGGGEEGGVRLSAIETKVKNHPGKPYRYMLAGKLIKEDES